jgi:hypothetical protein
VFDRCGTTVPIKRSPIELPPDVARRFVEDMRAYLIEPNGHKRDEIAARQLSILRGYQRPAREEAHALRGQNGVRADAGALGSSFDYKRYAAAQLLSSFGRIYGRGTRPWRSR